MGHGEGLGHGLEDRWEGLRAQCLGVLPPVCSLVAASGFWRGLRRSVCAGWTLRAVPQLVMVFKEQIVGQVGIVVLMDLPGYVFALETRLQYFILG